MAGSRRISISWSSLFSKIISESNFSIISESNFSRQYNTIPRLKSGYLF